MICVDGVAQPEAIGQERGPEQHCIAAKRGNRPSPGAEIGGDQNGVETDNLAAQTSGPIIEQTSELPHQLARGRGYSTSSASLGSAEGAGGFGS